MSAINKLMLVLIVYLVVLFSNVQSDCNVCKADNNMACVSTTQYQFCVTSAVSTISGTCAPNHFCSINYPQICGNATTGQAATCPSVEQTITTSTTVPTVVAPNNIGTIICQSVRQNGRFPIGNDLYTTCRQYVYCVLNNGIWSGMIYTCPGQTYFDDVAALCVTAIPARCGNTVQNLAIENIILN